jgi:hypothetical protein
MTLREFAVGWAKALLRRAHHSISRWQRWWARREERAFAHPTNPLSRQQKPATVTTLPVMFRDAFDDQNDFFTDVE